LTILLFSAALRSIFNSFSMIAARLCHFTTLQLPAATSLSCHSCIGVSISTAQPEEEQRVHRQGQYPGHPWPTRAVMSPKQTIDHLTYRPYSLRPRFHSLDSRHSTFPRTPPLSDPSSWVRMYECTSRVDLSPAKRITFRLLLSQADQISSSGSPAYLMSAVVSATFGS
jgi:hypothetical protein